MSTKKVRLNADLAPDVAEALQQLAASQGVSLAEAVRRAISNEHFLYQERRAGFKVLLEKNGEYRQLIFL